MENEWITTKELLAWLVAHPDEEVECRLWLGHGLGSTHYWYWDSVERCFMHTRDWPFSAMEEQWILEDYGDRKWRME